MSTTKSSAVFVVRHVQSVWNAAPEEIKKNTESARKLIDADVSELGKLQLAALSKIVFDRKIDIIFTSPLRRALHTAIAVQQATNAPIRVCGFLREIRRDYGDVGLPPRGTLHGLDKLSQTWSEDSYSSCCECQLLHECGPCADVRIHLIKKLIRKNIRRARSIVIVAHSDLIMRLCGWDAKNGEIAKFVSSYNNT